MSEKRNCHKFIKAGFLLGGLFLTTSLAARKFAEPDSVDQENPYLRSGSCDPCRSITPCSKVSFYEKHVKPGLDKALSFAGLILLAPVCAVISIAIYLDDPGPVLFAQKRVGKDGHFFELHKFRTMKMDTPHDVPTHQLADPEQYITRVGGFLRKYSLDELPQVWDIFRGKMSVIGPRPALWNQADLIAERGKYDANSVMPGLTGWAQINGRDELEITDKAALDGEYVRKLRSGNVKGMLADLRCFFGTVKSVAGSEGVVEGGTGRLQEDEAADEPKRSEPEVRKPGGETPGAGGGESERSEPEVRKQKKTSRVWKLKRPHGKKDVIPPADPADAGFEDYGYKKEFHIDKNAAKKVLITGAGSYVGGSFRDYAVEHYPNLTVDTVDMVDGSWREQDFSGYDSVFHVAGIAHADTGKVTEEEKKKYYEVNTDLAIETAKKCKAEGVKQFVLMSSMIVYGESAPYGKKKVIDEHTVPVPANFYGDSKWQADRGVRRLQDENFRVAVIRAPMIYGKGSKGNYPLLAKLAKKLPVFPDVENERSMLYIGNLCEFVSLLALSGEGGVYFPQNEEHVNTSELVRLIGGASGHKVRLVKWMRPLVAVAGCIPGKIGRLAGKAFGNSVYRQKISNYKGIDYCVTDFKNAVIYTEKGKQQSVLILVNHDVVIYNFRLELVERLLSEGYEVHISSPYGKRIDALVAMGAKHHEVVIDRHGINPFQELSLLKEYKKLIENENPSAVLAYTIKPNIYGGIAAGIKKIPFIANITGLGTAVENGGILQAVTLSLYRLGLRKAQTVFFQNKENLAYMTTRQIVPRNRCRLLPGSGVNLKQHCYEEYPEDSDKLIFSTVGRIMKDKGTDELLEAAENIKKKYPDVTFRVIGFFDEDYQEKIQNAVKKGIIEYIGQQDDIHPFLKKSHAVIHPSYHEGMSNVLLEAAATGRPVLAGSIPGCRETFDEGVSGIGFRPRDPADLVRAVEEFIKLPYEKKAQMGKEGRRKMEQEFDRQIVVEAYMKEIKKVTGTQKND